MDPYRSPAPPALPLFEPRRPRLWHELRWLVLGLGLGLVALLLAALEVRLDSGAWALPASDAPLGALGAVAATLAIGAACVTFYGALASLGHIGERREYQRLRWLANHGERIDAEVKGLKVCRDSDGEVQFFVVLDLGGGHEAEQRGFMQYHRAMLEPLGRLEPPELPKQDYARVGVALDPNQRFTMAVIVAPGDPSNHHIRSELGISAHPRRSTSSSR